MVQELLNKHFGDKLTVVPNTTPPSWLVELNNLRPVCLELRDHEDFYFDLLRSVSGVDYPQENIIEVVYHLYSIPKGHSIALKVRADRQSPQVPSLVSVWQAANWHERETFDLFGVNFLDHPDMRRILLPSDWKGFPLRKDYEEDEKYHGMTIKYEGDEPEHTI